VPAPERYSSAITRVEEILGGQMANESIAVKILAKTGSNIAVDGPDPTEVAPARSLHEVITDLQQTTNRLNSRLLELDELV
jgi:hypothetical protein